MHEDVALLNDKLIVTYVGQFSTKKLAITQ